MKGGKNIHNKIHKITEEKTEENFMAIAIEEKRGGSVLEVYATGKLLMKDYEQFVPTLEALIKEHGKIDMLFVMNDFHGWEPKALMEDVKFDIRHARDIGRMGFVGEKKWQEWMAALMRPFTSAEIRYFDLANLQQARNWIETVPVSTGPGTIT